MFVQSLPSKNVSCLVLSAIHNFNVHFFFFGSLHVYCEEYSLFFFLFWLCGLACGISVSWTGIGLASPSGDLEFWPLGHQGHLRWCFACGYPVVPGGSMVKYPPANARDRKDGLIPRLARSPGGEGKWQLTPVFLHRVSWAKGIGVLQSMGLQNVRHYCTITHALDKVPHTSIYNHWTYFKVKFDIEVQYVKQVKVGLFWVRWESQGICQGCAQKITVCMLLLEMARKLESEMSLLYNMLSWWKIWTQTYGRASIFI